MQILSRKSVIGAFALVAALSAPLAFAQAAEATVEATPATTTVKTGTSVQNTTAATETSAAASTEANAAPVAPVAAPAKKSWADVDADKNGKLTKAEAATVPALVKVFDQADGNADGALTADEYKAYAAQLQGGHQGADGSK